MKRKKQWYLHSIVDTGTWCIYEDVHVSNTMNSNKDWFVWFVVWVDTSWREPWSCVTDHKLERWQIQFAFCRNHLHMGIQYTRMSKKNINTKMKFKCGVPGLSTLLFCARIKHAYSNSIWELHYRFLGWIAGHVVDWNHCFDMCEVYLAYLRQNETGCYKKTRTTDVVRYGCYFARKQAAETNLYWSWWFVLYLSGKAF